MALKSLIKQIAAPIYRYASSKTERELLRLFDRWGVVDRYTAKEVSFLSYRFIVPDCLSFLWQFKEIFVDEIYSFQTENASPRILDCGANIGLSALYFKRLYPNARITAFEADPRIASLLKTNLTSNGFTDVEVINKAVWTGADGTPFGVERADGGSILRNEDQIMVDSVRLKSVLDGEAAVDMLKIDVEGAERDILLDSHEKLERVKHIFVEYHSLNGVAQHLDEILDLLTAAGFRYFIKGVQERSRPFINRGLDSEMDLQLNIFAYRV